MGVSLGLTNETVPKKGHFDDATFGLVMLIVCEQVVNLWK